jgi:hypothetical protein
MVVGVNQKTWVLFGAIPVAVLASCSTLLGPSPVAPASFFAIVPAMLISSALGDRAFASGRYLIPALAGLGYLAASAPLLAGRSWAWRSSAALFAILGVGNAAFLISTWSDGVQFQGASYSMLVVALNVVCGMAVALEFVLARRRNSSVMLSLAHVSLFCWLNWVGFPWFGEMP